jgi:hypothetical protein
MFLSTVVSVRFARSVNSRFVSYVTEQYQCVNFPIRLHGVELNFFFLIWFVRLLALRPLLAYAARLG